jgi:RsiW-degrading membrane proteinase PrsW (M82 family)
MFRALLPVSGHALFGVMMGYYMGKAKFGTPSEKNKLLLFSLLVPVFWHGLFDFILLQVTNNWIWFMVPLMVYLWLRSLSKVQRANARSPFRLVRREEEIKS